MHDLYLLISPYLFSLTLVFIYLVLEDIGWFNQIAFFLTALGQGSGKLLLLFLAIIAVIITFIFNNYGSILIWTPIVIKSLKFLNFSPKTTLLYILATGLITDFASPFLPWSNPINQITIEKLDISWLDYSLAMFPIASPIIVSSGLIFWLCFDRYIPPRYPLIIKNCPQNILLPKTLYYGGFILLGIFLICQLFNFSQGLILDYLGLLIIAILQRWYQPSRKPIFRREIIKKKPIKSIFYSLALSLIILSLTEIIQLKTWLSQYLLWITHWGLTITTLSTGFLTMIVANLTHNIPTMINNISAIEITEISDPTIKQAIIYSSIFGCTLGAKITPIGTISSLFWLEILKYQGLKLNFNQYLRIHIIIVIPLLFISLLILAWWLPWLQA